MSKPKKLIVITSGSYPYGGAATNRHLSYLKGLVELDIEVILFILQPANNQSLKSKLNKGEYNGIKYQYIIPIEEKSISKYGKIKNKIKSVSRCLKLLKEELIFSKDIKLLLLIIDPIELIPFLNFSKKKSLSVYHERTEFPYIGMRGFYRKHSLKLYLKVVKRFAPF